MSSNTIVKENKRVKIFELTWKNAIIWFISSQFVYFTMLLITIPVVESYSKEMKIFDLMPTGYSYDYAVQLLKGLGADGRNAYLYYQIPLDIIYPFLMGITGVFFIKLIIKQLNFRRLSFLIYLPIIAACFDYLENFMVIGMINLFRNLSPTLVGIASIFTTIKSLFTVIYLTALSVLAIISLYNLLKKRLENNEEHASKGKKKISNNG
ncbi:MAG: hypothetical protein K0S51_1830 [Bacillales bacterium]|jgi:hypothetical protein|nr:hypothetical protein [Bacillales bacterium]